MIPRIRGKVGIIDDPPELAGQFAFEISLWDLTGETKIGESFGPFGPFKTDREAQDELKKATKSVCEEIERTETGDVSGRYLDLKNGGVMRPWVEQ